MDSRTEPITTTALAVAITQIGIKEKPLGSNAGVEIAAYLASVGISAPSPWCMSFVYWCYARAAKQHETANPLYKTGGCLMQWQKTTCKKITIAQAVADPALVVPGAIFIIDHGKGRGHTGLIEKIENGFLHTIEGNTNTNGSRNGIGVYRLLRPLSAKGKIIGFIVP